MFICQCLDIWNLSYFSFAENKQSSENWTHHYLMFFHRFFFSFLNEFQHAHFKLLLMFVVIAALLSRKCKQSFFNSLFNWTITNDHVLLVYWRWQFLKKATLKNIFRDKKSQWRLHCLVKLKHCDCVVSMWVSWMNKFP